MIFNRERDSGPFLFRVTNTEYYEKELINMRYFTKKLLTKTTISLIAGIANVIGMKVGAVIWDGCAKEKTRRSNERSYAQ